MINYLWPICLQSIYHWLKVHAVVFFARVVTSNHLRNSSEKWSNFIIIFLSCRVFCICFFVFAIWKCISWNYFPISTWIIPLFLLDLWKSTILISVSLNFKNSLVVFCILFFAIFYTIYREKSFLNKIETFGLFYWWFCMQPLIGFWRFSV